MDRALWLLLWLRFWAWLRRLWRNAGSIRGALLLIIVCIFFFLFIGPSLFMQIWESDRVPRQVEVARRFGPLILLVYCFLNVLLPSNERGIFFTPGEVNFLFPAPLSRRQLLLYKIMSNALLALVYGLVMAGFLLTYSPGIVSAYVGVVLALWFVQLFSITLTLIANTTGAHAFNWQRRLVLALALLLAAGILFQLARGAEFFRPGEFVDWLDQTLVMRILLLPVHPFIATFTAEQLWPDLVRGAVLSLLIDGLLLGVVFSLDAHYLESAAMASERFHAQLQRTRSNGMMATRLSYPVGKSPWRLPMLPCWGGIGPLVWRQAMTAFRSLRGILFLLVLLAMMIFSPLLAGKIPEHQEVIISSVLAVAVLSITLLMLPPLLIFDFRGDVDRIDFLKTLPLPAAYIVLGQLLTPALLLSGIQLAAMLVVQVLWGGVNEWLLGTAILAPVINFLSLGMENLLFLWFPTRMTPATPGDFQIMGRQLLLMWMKTLGLGLAVGIATMIGGTIYFVLTELVNGVTYMAALTAAFFAASGVLVVAAAGLVPLLALAFRNFDVASDTPP